MRDTSQTSRVEAAELVEVRIRNDVIRHAQKNHFASQLFSLDEIVIPPRLLAPPALVEPGVQPPYLDITEQIIPYMPDAPELASFYGAPTLTMMQALRGSTHLAILGFPGSGKTIALSYLAIQIARQESRSPEHKRLLPVYVHANDVLLPSDKTADNILAPLLVAIARVCRSVQIGRLEKHLKGILESGNLLVLYDGLDELSPREIDKHVSYLEQILTKYPQIRIVTAISPIYFGDLTRLNFVPMAIVNWGDTERREFINRWSEMWITKIEPLSRDPGDIDPILLNAWLINDNTILSPLEQTLKVWGVYAGDLRGAMPLDWIEAFIQRMSGYLAEGRPALEILAGRSILEQSPAFSVRDAGVWLRVLEPRLPEETGDVASSVPVEPEGQTAHTPEKTTRTTPNPIRDSNVVPALIGSGFLVERAGERLSIFHPLIHSYLAAHHIAKKVGEIDNLVSVPWYTAWHAQGFLSAQHNLSPTEFKYFTENPKEPLCREIIFAARWLRYSPEQGGWRSEITRKLIKILQGDESAIGLKARAALGLALSGNADLESIFRQFLSSPDASNRQVAALICGLLRDAKSINDLVALLADSNRNVRRAACLSLVAVGHKNAMEAVAELLLHGDDDQRRSAAEAMANNVEEGHPTLQEGASYEDVSVRRAVVFGLRRARLPWAIELLQKMQLHDTQWLVKDSAAHALEEIALPDPRLPKALPELSQSPWVISFAGERGIGVSPGRPALDLLMQAIKEGSEEQRLAGLDYLNRYPDFLAIPDLVEAYSKTRGDVHEAIYSTLWQFASAGIFQPDSTQDSSKMQ